MERGYDDKSRPGNTDEACDYEAAVMTEAIVLGIEGAVRAVNRGEEKTKNDVVM